MNLEELLKDSLRHERPSAGFADRVARRAVRDRRRQWRGVAAAAAAVVVITAAGAWREVTYRREAEQAKNELMLAMKITAEKTNQAREAVRD